jgi:predicted small metal-binding protein
MIVMAMAKEEYKQVTCSDIGMACGFQVRAKTDAEVMEHMKLHAARTHGLKEVPPDIEKEDKGKHQNGIVRCAR